MLKTLTFNSAVTPVFMVFGFLMLAAAAAATVLCLNRRHTSVAFRYEIDTIPRVLSVH